MTRYNPTTHADLARLHAIDAANWPPRIVKALEQIGRALDPYRGGGDGGPGTLNGISDPTGTAAVDDDRTATQARNDKRDLTRAILRLHNDGSTIARILNEWAPVPKRNGAGDTSNAALWCENHRRYGRNEPRAGNGRRNCEWCCDVHADYGQWPTVELVKAHDQGRRLSPAEYQRALGGKAS
jgi:hypothetical protein